MATIVDNAGRSPEPAPADPKAARREVLRSIRAILRDPAASDDDVDDALEALVEAARYVD